MVGPEGYSDYQRTTNQDGPAFLEELAGTEKAGEYRSAMFNTSRYQYLGGELSTTVNPCTVFFHWYLTETATVQVGLQRINLSPLIPNPLQIRLQTRDPT